MKRLLPYPLLFLALLAMWLLLAGSLGTGQVLLGVIVSLLACWAVVAVEPPKPRIPTRPGRAAKERRLQEKRVRANIKRGRSSTGWE